MMDRGNNNIVGTWKLVSVVTRPASGGEAVNAMGENPSCFLTYTSDGRMTVILASGGRQKLSVTDPGGAPAAERAEAFATFLAYAGGYTVDVDTITHHVEVSWLQNWVGTDQIRFASLRGNLFTLSSPPTLMGGTQTVVELAWTRFG